MNERLKTFFKYLGGTALTLLVIYLVCFVVFLVATHPNRAQAKETKNIASVSYTHLTLPTIA